jgi:hypothetical protein
MKRLLLTAAALGLAGSISTANAAPVGPPDNSITVDMWNLANTVGTPTGNHNESGDDVQQALPTARGAIVAAGGTHFGAVSYTQPINYNLTNPAGDVASSINQFFAADVGGSGLPPASCTAACTTLTGSAPLFASVTLFEVTFSTPGESFTVQHDDGVSLFNALDTTFASNLLPGVSGPVSSELSGPVNLAGGTYNLFYTSANGTPEVLQTGTVVPAPLIGHGLLVLLAVGGVLFGGKFLESLKTRHSHAA